QQFFPRPDVAKQQFSGGMLPDFVGDDVSLDACEHPGSVCAVWRPSMAVAGFSQSERTSVGAGKVGRCSRVGRDAYPKPCGDGVLECIARVSIGTRTRFSGTVCRGSKAGSMCRG